MARLEIIGKIKDIGQLVAIPTGNGSFEKRDLVLDCSMYDQFEGTKIENYVQFEFGGKHSHDLDSFKVGDKVKVAFALRGRYQTLKGQTEQKLIVNIIGYDCQPYASQNSQQQQSQAAAPSPTSESEKGSQEGQQGDLLFWCYST